MGRRSAPARRSAGEWAIRALVAAVAALLAYVSLTQTLGYAVKARYPERAHALAPRDGRITALAAAAALTPEAGPAERAQAGRLARLALVQDPTAVPAVVTLGLGAQIDGDQARARRSFDYSWRLTRRDLKSRIWGIEDAVARGDVPGALHQYDVALRTSRDAPELLFPVLSGASGEPAVAAGLVRTLAARPPWGNNFIDNLAGTSPAPRASARLLTALRRVGVPVSEAAQAVTVTRLLSHGAAEQAWAFYAAARPGADRRRSRDPLFAADRTDPTPFDWVPTEDAGIAASIQRGDRGGVLDFGVPSGVGGNVVRQVQLLPPGRYILEGHSIGIDQPEGSRPFWTLTCGDNRELGRVVLPNSAEGGGVFSGRLAVPANCSVQQLTLVARASDTVSGSTGQIDRVQLRPEG